jgi:hypothetical protein
VQGFRMQPGVKPAIRRWWRADQPPDPRCEFCRIFRGSASPVRPASRVAIADCGHWEVSTENTNMVVFGRMFRPALGGPGVAVV